jgi:hypothetical protein
VQSAREVHQAPLPLATRQRGRSQRAPSASAEPGAPRAACWRMTSKRSEAALAYMSQSPSTPRTHGSSTREAASSRRIAAQNASGVTAVAESSRTVVEIDLPTMAANDPALRQESWAFQFEGLALRPPK